MASGKRASMREGPLAALFRRTDEEGVEGREEPPAPASDKPADAPASPREGTGRGHARPAQERLRDVFSTEIPHNIMDREPARREGDGDATRDREGPQVGGGVRQCSGEACHRGEDTVPSRVAAITHLPIANIAWEPYGCGPIKTGGNADRPMLEPVHGCCFSNCAGAG